MELCLLKEKTKLEDARVLNSNRERERDRERESNAMQNEKGNWKGSVCVCLYMQRE